MNRTSDIGRFMEEDNNQLTVAYGYQETSDDTLYVSSINEAGHLRLLESFERSSVTDQGNLMEERSSVAEINHVVRNDSNSNLNHTTPLLYNSVHSTNSNGEHLLINATKTYPELYLTAFDISNDNQQRDNNNNCLSRDNLYEADLICPICQDILKLRHSILVATQFADLVQMNGYLIKQVSGSESCPNCRRKTNYLRPLIRNITVNNFVESYIQIRALGGDKDWQSDGSKLVEWLERKRQWQTASEDSTIHLLVILK
ncbi:hypothetical protein F5877DRAFT_65347 [Lentinula edodes]|nr:hypothetical protein F5877DRAFT_65347 [Lentinula edodes]